MVAGPKPAYAHAVQPALLPRTTQRSLMNQPVTIQPVPKKVVAILDRGKVVLPADAQNKVDAFWQAHTADKPNYFNGEVFMIVDMQFNADELIVHLAETNYAHHLYTAKVGDLGEYNNRSIHPTTMVVTSDNKLIFGKMGKHTGRAGLIQCCGGGLDFKDVDDDGIVNITGTAGRELAEELGIDVHDPTQVKSLEPRYLTRGGHENKMALVHIVQMAITGEQCMQNYQKFLQTESQPEFDEVYCIDRDQKTAQDFIAKNHASMSEEFQVILERVVQ